MSIMTSTISPAFPSILVIVDKVVTSLILTVDIGAQKIDRYFPWIEIHMEHCGSLTSHDWGGSLSSRGIGHSGTRFRSCRLGSIILGSHIVAEATIDARTRPHSVNMRSDDGTVSSEETLETWHS